jgi:hypothetical protein
MSKSTNCEKCAHHPICEWCDKHIITFRFPQGNNVCEFFRAYAPQSEWISVDERLPDKQAQYLIVDDEGYMEVALWTRQFGWFSHVNRGNKVTHWMPLPEPPKGE